MAAFKGDITELETAAEMQVPVKTLVPPTYIQTLDHGERRRAERKLVRKIDIRVLPAVVVMYLMNYLDRNNIAAARLAGLETDLKLHGTQYQTCKIFRIIREAWWECRD